jgi:hypothetical protein
MSDIIGGLINGLLTGGILIGKICQALGGGPNSKVYVDEESGVTVVGEVSSGGVKFFRSDSSGESVVYAFNPDTSSPVMVTIPNEEDASGVTYIIPSTQKVPIGEVDSPLVSPTLNVTTGPTVIPSSSPDMGPKNVIKLSFSGLKLDKLVNVGSFKLSCNTTQLVIVSAAISINTLTYMYLKSDKGVTVSNQNQIPPTPPTATNAVGEVEQRFDIDFASLGIDLSADTIEGQLTLEADPSGDKLLKLSKMPSEPLHAAEQEFFARLSRGEL